MGFLKKHSVKNLRNCSVCAETS